MDIKVPLKMLKFGHEDGEGINARVAGRDDGIAALAANIYANRSDANPSGLIENLIVKDAGDGFYSVANGNRRLKALHMIGLDSGMEIGCTVHDVDETKAFEFSLTTAITAQQLHPVDQYEAFARLEEHGKTNDEIAAQYGLSEKEVRQALALGRLSPKIRQSWRAGEVKAQTAQAFTLAKDHKAQDKIFAKLAKSDDLNPHSVRTELGVKSNAHLAELIAFITPDFYRECGGKITEDLFGEYHTISNEALVKTLATDKLDKHCNELIASGWSWAKPLDDLPAHALHWAQRDIPEKDMIWLDGEKERHADLKKQMKAMENDSGAYYDQHEEIEAQIDEIEREVHGRSFVGDNEKHKEKLGCIINIVEGVLQIKYGVSKPAEQLQVKGGTKTADLSDDEASAGKAAPAPKESTTTISNALAERLVTQLLHATKDALLADTVGSHPLVKILAGIVAEQIKPEQKFHMPSAVLNKLMTLRGELDAGAVNAAIAKRFDAKDYFSTAPAAVVLKAVKEAINADEARKLVSSTKAEIARFALANVVKTGWLPKELRTVHYDGPGSDGYKKPVAAKAEKPPASAKPAERKKQPARKAAPAKKAAKKSAAKKRKAR